MSARPLAVGAAAALALGVAAEWLALYRPSFAVPATPGEERLAVADFAAGAALVAGAAVSLWKARTPAVGALLGLAGLAWFAGSLAPSGFEAPAAVGAYLVALHRGPLVHALLAFPRGALRSRWERAGVIGVYAVSIVGSVGENAGVRLGVAALLVAGATSRRRRMTPRVAAFALAAVIAAAAVADIAGVDAATAHALAWAYDLTVAAVAVALTLALTTGASVAAAVTRIVVDLGDASEAGVLANRLGRAVGDRSLLVALPSETALGAEVHGRARTDVYDGSTLVAVIVHDPETFDDADIRSAAVEAVRVAVANAKLRREIERQADELRASRRRLVVSADRERELLERDLEARTGHHLARLRELLTDADQDGADLALLGETLDELSAASVELAELAQGLRPRLLTDGGLPAALAELGRRAPVPVSVDAIRERLPAEVEAAAYFVVAEALANVAKHSGAATASVTVLRAGDVVRVAVRDDGRGGASPGAGSGLRGLVDRVEALGGLLEVESAPGGGTTVTAELPL